ncbi:hypothetical protein Ancab_038314 [Ancistrocladus abbreviatus]
MGGRERQTGSESINLAATYKIGKTGRETWKYRKGQFWNLKKTNRCVDVFVTCLNAKGLGKGYVHKSSRFTDEHIAAVFSRCKNDNDSRVEQSIASHRRASSSHLRDAKGKSLH